jgi:E3 ubiquitin-protein ligase MYCBP2
VFFVAVNQIPQCLIALQQSVQAVLVGRVQIPDWLTHGIPQEARITSAFISSDLRLSRLSGSETYCNASLASDGRFLYLHSANCGLVKIGSGYGNTVMVRKVIICFRRVSLISFTCLMIVDL